MIRPVSAIPNPSAVKPKRRHHLSANGTGAGIKYSSNAISYFFASVIPRSVRTFGFASSIDRRLWQALQSCVIVDPSFAA
jgi:hypothetical protein